MEKKLRFLIDVDEVLRELLSNMIFLYNKEFNENIRYDDVKDFKVETSFPKIQEITGVTASQWFFQDNGDKLFLNSQPFPYIKKDIEILKMYGEVIIVTYQKSYINKHQTLEWLEKNGIEPDGICFLKDKTIISGDYFIDDNDWNFIGCNAKIGILINAPYNKHVDTIELLKKTNCESLKRFESLHDFVCNFQLWQKINKN